MYRKRVVAAVLAVVTGLGGGLVASTAASATPSTAHVQVGSNEAAVSHGVRPLAKPPRPTKQDSKPAGQYSDVAKQLPGKPASAGTAKAFTVGPYYFYGMGSQGGTGFSTTGTVFNLVVPNPPTAADTTDHTLAEAALSENSQQQIIEAGAGVDRSLYGDDDEHLFVYLWVNGAPQCYNGCGWVDYAPTATNVGADLTTLGLTGTHKFTLQYISGNWWLAFDSDWIGYFPESIWTSAGVASFNHSDLNQYFGEVASPSNATPCTNMGYGALVTSTSTTADKFSGITYLGSTTSPSMTMWNSDPSEYNAVLASGSVRAFYFGGDGFC